MLEETYVNQLEDQFKSNGWQTFREVVPDECKNWSKPFRVDLIVYKKEVGYVGIEAKSINVRQGGILAQAHKQIQKYRNKNYFNGTKINLWAVAIKFNTTERYAEVISSSLIREFFCAYGIGFVFENHSIDFGYSQAWAKIPFKLSNHNMDIKRIIQSQQKKSTVSDFTLASPTFPTEKAINKDPNIIFK